MFSVNRLIMELKKNRRYRLKQFEVFLGWFLVLLLIDTQLSLSPCNVTLINHEYVICNKLFYILEKKLTLIPTLLMRKRILLSQLRSNRQQFQVSLNPTHHSCLSCQIISKKRVFKTVFNLPTQNYLQCQCRVNQACIKVRTILCIWIILMLWR